MVSRNEFLAPLSKKIQRREKKKHANANNFRALNLRPFHRSADGDNARAKSRSTDKRRAGGGRSASSCTTDRLWFANRDKNTVAVAHSHSSPQRSRPQLLLTRPTFRIPLCENRVNVFLFFFFLFFPRFPERAGRF